MGNVFYFEWEVKLLTFFQQFMSPLAIMVAKCFTLLGQPATMVLLISVFYIGIDKKLGEKIALYAVTAIIFNCMIKNIFLRIRPYFNHEGVECLVPVDSDYDVNDIVGQGYSFPSCHSTNSVVIPSTIYLHYKKKFLLVIAIIAALGVGISRSIVGVHYPTDILVGWLQGLLTILIMPKLYQKMDRKLMYILLIIVCGIGFFYCNSNDYYSSYGLLIGVVLSLLYDEKISHFKNTKNPLKIVLRLLLSGGVFLALNTIMKMPFSEEFLDSASLVAYLFRTFRYATCVFVSFGLCPTVYKYNILKLDDKMKEEE